MKNLSLTLLMAALPSFALAENIVSVESVGNFNQARVQQSGQDNYLQIQQRGDYNVTQNSTGRGAGDTRGQTGVGNKLVIQQLGTSNRTDYLQAGAYNTSNLELRGNHSGIQSNVQGTANEVNTTAVGGNNNYATDIQGSNNAYNAYAYNEYSGINHPRGARVTDASMVVRGDSNRTVLGVGGSAKVDATINGNNNSLNLRAEDQRAHATQDPTVVSNRQQILMQGDFNTLNSYQEGRSENILVTGQNGTANRIDAMQKGNDMQQLIIQDGTSHTLVGLQEGIGHRLDAMQTGNGQIANVSQTSANNSVVIRQGN